MNTSSPLPSRTPVRRPGAAEQGRLKGTRREQEGEDLSQGPGTGGPLGGTELCPVLCVETSIHSLRPPQTQNHEDQDLLSTSLGLWVSARCRGACQLLESPVHLSLPRLPFLCPVYDDDLTPLRLHSTGM